MPKTCWRLKTQENFLESLVGGGSRRPAEMTLFECVVMKVMRETICAILRGGRLAHFVHG